jgi:hypothetical protein
MDRVVLCEGKRDVKLVEQFYEETRSGVEVTTFLGEQVHHSNLKNRESAALRNFTERRNPYDVLAKSENGVTNLERVFVKLARHLLQQPDFRVCLLTDLDKKNYDHLSHASDTRKYRELVSDLDERIRDNYRGSDLRLERNDLHAKSPVQIAGEATLHSGQGAIGAFDVLAFRSDLEDAAEIAKDDDSTDEQVRKLTEFVLDRASGPMYEVL